MSYKSRSSRPDFIQDQHQVVTTRTRSIPGEGPCHHCFVNVNLLRIYYKYKFILDVATIMMAV